MGKRTLWTLSANQRVGKTRRSAGALPAPPVVGLAPSFVHCEDGSRELRVGDHVLKQFRKPGPNQEAILTAFQEQGWKKLVEKPLPSRSGRSLKLRLHDAVKKLNRGQKAGPPYVRFHMDGSGLSVWWEIVD